MDAKFTILTNSTKGVIEYQNGAKIIFDQDKVFYSSQMKNLSIWCFYMGIFFPFPHKLSDPGTIWMNTIIKKKTLQII
jgi:glucan biosynthesis protein